MTRTRRRPAVETPLGEALRNQGRKQTWLAERLSERLGRDVERRQVWGWVWGQHVPEPETQKAISELIDIPVAELFHHLPDHTRNAA